MVCYQAVGFSNYLPARYRKPPKPILDLGKLGKVLGGQARRDELIN
jgi:hypothetical protein